MTDLGLLCGTPDSPLGRAGAVALAGFEASLRRALELSPADDPNRDGFLRVLESLSARASAAPAQPGWKREPTLEPLDAPPRAPSAPAAATPTRGGQLAKLFQEFASDPAVKQEFGQLDQAPPAAESALWVRFSVLLLRASKPLAEAWRERLRSATGGPPGGASVVLPGEQEEELYPPFPGSTEPTGLRLSPSAPTDERLGDPGNGLAARLARPLTVALWLMNNEPFELHHAIEAVSRFGRIPLWGTPNSAQVRAQAERELVQRFKALRDARDPGAEALAWRALDEALNGLLHNPVAHETSWWRGVQKRARDTVLELRERVLAAGHELSILFPEGKYADAQQHTDKRSDKPAEDPVPPGDVVVCLRIFMKLNGTTYPGRVLYRPR